MIAGLLLNLFFPWKPKRTLRPWWVLPDGRVFIDREGALRAAAELAARMQVVEAPMAAEAIEEAPKELRATARQIGDLLGKFERQGPEALIHQVASRNAAVGQFRPRELKMLARMIEREYDEDDVVVLLTIS